MNKCEIIERLKNIAGYAVHTVGEEPFVMSLDDGIAVHEAIELLKKPETNCSEFPNNCPAADVVPVVRCKDCKYYKFGICMKIGANKSFYGFCDWAERGEQNE